MVVDVIKEIANRSRGDFSSGSTFEYIWLAAIFLSSYRHVVSCVQQRKHKSSYLVWYIGETTTIVVVGPATTHVATGVKRLEVSGPGCFIGQWLKHAVKKTSIRRRRKQRVN